MDFLVLAKEFGLPAAAVIVLAIVIWRVMDARVKSQADELKDFKTSQGLELKELRDSVNELNKYIRETLAEKLSEAHARERVFMEMIHHEFEPDQAPAHKTDAVLKSIYNKG